MIRTFILAVQTAPANNAGMNLWDMVVMGGWLMIPIFILSVIIIYIACERFWLIRKTGLTDVPFMEKIQEILKTGNTRVALEECEKEGSPLAHTIAKGIKISNEDPQEIRQAMEDTANYEVANLERGLPTLATCAGTAPMIGFLGTVVGMVQSFYDMSMAWRISCGSSLLILIPLAIVCASGEPSFSHSSSATRVFPVFKVSCIFSMKGTSVSPVLRISQNLSQAM